MAISMSRAGSTVTVTVTVDITGMSLINYTPVQRRILVAEAAAKQLHDASRLEAKTDEEIDAEYTAKSTALTAERDALKASRPTGNL